MKAGGNAPQRQSAPPRPAEQWQRVDDKHPLLETASTSGSTAYSYTSSAARPTINTALLLQSAARSVLDSEAMTSPSNASETETSSPAGHGTPSRLSSLQRERLPAMPDEQDRRRFIGCLAAVLAASYDFDVVDKYLDDAGSCTQAQADSLAFLEEEEEESPVWPTTSTTTTRQQHRKPLEGTVGGSFRSSATEGGDYSQQQQPDGRERRRDVRRVRLSRQQNRKRRYDILSRLLLSSADYLVLERSQAKAFLPMLAKLLVPQAENKSRKPTWSPPRKQGNRPDHSPSSTASFSTHPSVLAAIENVAVDDFESRESDIVNREINDIEHLRPFLESMTPGGGFRCLALVMLQYLIQSQEGYDSRIRQAIKTLGVIILYRDMSLDHNSDIASDAHDSVSLGGKPADLVTLATRRFESLEHCLAATLLEHSRAQQNHGRKNTAQSSAGAGEFRGFSREQIVRGIKVGAMGMAAAGLFAVTGGLAAPGIAAGVAAIPGLAATAAAATVLTSTAAVTAIFGVGGGTLVAYKVNRRTMGLTEFEFRKETGHAIENQRPKEAGVEAELFTTICLSGWLRDECDFQRPWGVSPANPWIKDQQELLERFYSVYRPDHILKSKRILKSWEGEEEELWKLLRQKYGRDPDHLYPLTGGTREEGALTLDQMEVVDQLFVELGYTPNASSLSKATKDARKGRLGWGRRRQEHKAETTNTAASKSALLRTQMDSLHGPNRNISGSTGGVSSITSTGFETDIGASVSTDQDETDEAKESVPKHVATVWDYHAHYGGELYTVRWESDVLEELCASVKDLAYDLVNRGTAQILRHTAMATLLSAIAWPTVLVNAANMIDGTWTLAVERADEAGKELARSLLFSKAGHRPVTLVGFSFGARIIYSCLKEMAKYQERWYDYQESLKEGSNGRPSQRTTRFDSEESDSLADMREPASIIEDVVIMGLPNHLSITSWMSCRQVVSGRLVNCFSQKDLILSLMFQFKRLGLKPVCGTLPVSVPGVENFDVSDLVTGHQDYCTATGEILKRVRLGEPFRSKPIRMFDPEVPSADEGTMPDKFDV